MTTRNFAVSHLSEDDLDEVLLDIAPPAAFAHLAACEFCAKRFTAFQTQFQAQMSAFNRASLAWSEARSNTISRDLAAHRPGLRLTPAAMWYSTAAAILAVAFTLTTNLHRDAGLQAGTGTAQTETVASATPEEIDADNAMLAAISSETATPRPARFGLYEGNKTEAVAPRATIRQVKD